MYIILNKSRKLGTLRELRKSKKAQAAMEFLMTYGWALIVIIIVISALVFFGSLDADSRIADRADLGTGFIVNTVSVGTDIIIISVTNAIGKPVIGFQIEALDCDNSIMATAISNPMTIDEGKTEVVVIPCDGPIQGTKFKTNLKISYDIKTLSETLSHENKGLLVSEVGGSLSGPEGVIFDFSAGPDGWFTGGDANPPWAYGSQSPCGDNFGVPAMYADQCSTTDTWDDPMWSPEIDLSGMSTATVSASVWKNDETQWGWFFDIGYVLISQDGGLTWDTLSPLGYTGPGWTTVTYDVSAYTGGSVWLGFLFETLDGCCSFETFAVTNISVTEGTPACDCAVDLVCCPIAGMVCEAAGCTGYDYGPNFGYELTYADGWMCGWEDQDFFAQYEYCYDGGFWDIYDQFQGYCGWCDDPSGSNCNDVYDQSWTWICSNCACPFT